MEERLATLPSAKAEVQEVHEIDGVQALVEFNSLLAQHGEEIVESPRLPGVPLALNVLMNACPEPVTEQNAHKFLAEAQALLEATQAKKKTDLEEDITPEEQADQEQKEKPEEIEESDLMKTDETKADTQPQATENQQPENDSHASSDEKTNVNVIVKIAQKLDSENKVASIREPGLKAGRADEAVGQTLSTEKGTAYLKASQSVQNIKSTVPLKKQKRTADKKPVEPVHSKIQPNREEITYIQSKTTKDSIPTVIKKTPYKEVVPENGKKDESEKVRIEFDRIVEMHDEAVDIQIPDTRPDRTILFKKIEHRESKEYLTLQEYEAVSKELEAENYIDESAEVLSSVVNQEVSEITDIAEKEQVILTEPTANNEVEVNYELPVPVERQMEHVVQALADRIEQLEIEGSEGDTKAGYKILDEIAVKVTKIRVNAKNEQVELESSPEPSPEAEEELKKLFIKLFDHTKAECTPELIDSLTKIAMSIDIPENLKLQKEEEVPTAVQGQGTHEVIKHLLAAAASIKKRMLQAYNIGKSILQLSSQKLITIKAI